jgi:hypothetical protein
MSRVVYSIQICLTLEVGKLIVVSVHSSKVRKDIRLQFCRPLLYLQSSGMGRKGEVSWVSKDSHASKVAARLPTVTSHRVAKAAETPSHKQR